MTRCHTIITQFCNKDLYSKLINHYTKITIINKLATLLFDNEKNSEQFARQQILMTLKCHFALNCTF